MADPSYIPKKDVNLSYRPKSNVMSPGLQRARSPFRFRNAFTGLILASFAIGVWAYSISAVAQDDFSDVDEEAAALSSSPTSSSGEEKNPKGTLLVSTTAQTTEGVIAVGSTAVSAVPSSRSPILQVVEEINTPRVDSGNGSRPKGLVSKLLHERYPWVLDPKNRTLIWGAPSVDSFGRVRDNFGLRRK